MFWHFHHEFCWTYGRPRLILVISWLISQFRSWHKILDSLKILWWNHTYPSRLNLKTRPNSTRYYPLLGVDGSIPVILYNTIFPNFAISILSALPIRGCPATSQCPVAKHFVMQSAITIRYWAFLKYPTAKLRTNNLAHQKSGHLTFGRFKP